MQRFSVLEGGQARRGVENVDSTHFDLSTPRREIHCRRGGPAITRDEGPVHAGAKVLIRRAQSLGAWTGFFA